MLKSIEGETRNGEHVDGIIDNLISTGVKTPDYFIKTTYKDSQNKTQPKYLMSRAGFSLLVMGFTGKKAFRWKVDYIKRYDQMEQYIASLHATHEEFPEFTDAIKNAHDTPMPYHYSNESNMIYGIVLGMSAKRFREMNEIPKGYPIRPHMTLNQIQVVESLQRIDIGLLEAGLPYDKRKEILSSKFQRQHMEVAS